MVINVKIKVIKGIKHKAEKLSKLYMENINEIDRKEIVDVFYYLKSKLDNLEEDLRNGKDEKRD